MPQHISHISGVEYDPNCACPECLSPSKKPRRLPFINTTTIHENQPIVKGNNRYGAKGTIRCLACQRRKGKCEFPPDKPEQPCEHCKRRGLRCGDKLPTERKRQLFQSQDEHSFLRQHESTWNSQPSPPQQSQQPYRYTEEQRPYQPYLNGSRSVASAAPTLPEPRHATTTFAPRPYLSGPPLPNISRQPPPPLNLPPPPPPPPQQILFPFCADLVGLIESQIPKITIPEACAVGKSLGEELRFVNNSSISNVTISRNNQEFSRGDSWFNVAWYETVDHRMVPRSVNLRFEPGRGVCTSYEVEGNMQSSPPPPQREPIPYRHEIRESISESSGSPMEVDQPKEMAEWTAAVGDLFEQAAGIKVKKDTEARDNSPPDMPIDEIPIVKLEEEPSFALWPSNMWKTIKAIIWGEELDKSKKMYRIGIPHATLNVLVERAQAIVGVFCSEEPKPVDTQEFIYHQPRKKVSLKTIAILLSQLHALKAKKPQSASETIQIVEETLVDPAPVNVDLISPRKRRFEEMDSPNDPDSSKRSMSSESVQSTGTSQTLVSETVKVEYDEETSNAASILNNVSKNRLSEPLPSPIHIYKTYFKQVQISSSQISQQEDDRIHHPSPYYNSSWMHGYAQRGTYR